MSVRIEHGDCLAVMSRLAAEDVQVDSIVTDPPYHLTSIVKRFGAEESKPVRAGVYRRSTAGFMGKKWDGGDVAFRPETWRLAFDLLKPGGHLIAFGGTRTYHRLACAIEDAGFEIRDQLQWLFGSGFPKSHDVGKAIDKAAGAEREITRERYTVKRIKPGATVVNEGAWGKQDIPYIATDSEPATDDAKQWNGWGTALKPACEPIVLARKPLSEKSVATNVLKHGTGAINVDGCRVEAKGRPAIEGDYKDTNNVVYEGRMDGSLAGGSKAAGTTDQGRWPANVVHDGSDEVMEAFAISGKTRQGHWADKSYGFGDQRSYNQSGIYAQDIGTAARFFYSAKADSTDRLGSKHPTVKPVDLMRWLVRLVTPPHGTVLDPFAGTGTTGMACLAEGFNAILIEREAEYVADIKNRIAHVNGHNTPLFASAE